MKKFFIGVVWTAGILISLPAWAGLFSSCDGASGEAKPEWVSKPDYSLKDSYVGVGSAEKEGRSKDLQREASEKDAKSHLVEQIEVKIKAESKQSIGVNDRGVQKNASSEVTVSAEEVLRGLSVRERWVDKDTCAHWTLMVVSKESVAQAKREKFMKNRLAKFKELLAEGKDGNKNRDIKVRRNYLEEAQALLADIDFKLLPEELQSGYVKQLKEALAFVDKETSKVQGRMALFAMKSDDTVPQNVLDKMLDRLRAANKMADRLMGCTTPEECMGKAKEMGFSALALLKVSGQVGMTAMGSNKGTIKITRTVYDVDSPKVEKSRDVGTAQVIGWGNEELDWDAAAEKAMEGWK